MKKKKHGIQPGSNTKNAPVYTTLNIVSSYQNPHMSYNTSRMIYQDKMDVEVNSDDKYPNDDLPESDTDSEDENISTIIEGSPT